MLLVTLAPGPAVSADNLQGIRFWCILKYPLTGHCVQLHPLAQPHLEETAKIWEKTKGGLSSSFPLLVKGFQVSPLANGLMEVESCQQNKESKVSPQPIPGKFCTPNHNHE